MKRGGPIKRRTPMRSGPPIRKPSGRPPAGSRRRPKPTREFWATRREELYARAGGRCEHGGCSLDHLGMQAHHRRLRSQGGEHGLENLTALCPTHHRWMHDHPAQAMVLGYIVSASAEPADLPILLHDGRMVVLLEDGSYYLEAPK